MKKIVSAALAASLLAGAATAEVKISANARIYADALTYETPTKQAQSSTTDGNGEGKDDNGDLIWGKETKHADDWTIEAKGENVGAKVKVSVESHSVKGEEAANASATNAGNADSGTSSSIKQNVTALTVGYYNIWANIGKFKVEAGAYDQRLAKNLNIDKNWGTNLSVGKPGINTAFSGGTTPSSTASWGSEAFDIGAIAGKTKSFTNVQVSSKELVDGMTLHGVLFLNQNGWSINSENSSDNESDTWIFAPFALALETKVAGGDLKVVGKLNQITQARDDVGVTNPLAAAPQNSVWTLGADYATKVGGGTFETAYTLGASIYTANSRHHGHYTGTSKIANATSTSQTRLVRDLDVFAHGFDFRWQGKVADAVTFSALSHFDYIQSTAFNRHDAKASKGTYKDRRALSYGTGAAGQLAYNIAFGVDYKYSDALTLITDLNIANTNLFDTSTGDSSKAHVDYYKNMAIMLQPGFQYAIEGSSVVFGGVRIKVNGFQRNATGKNNTVKTNFAIPVGMRIKL